MASIRIDKYKLGTPIGRWAGIGPYYAMFPIQFAFDVVERYSPQGGAVLDPFAGRGSSVYAAATTRRIGYGIEINDVGWVYGNTKLNIAPCDAVLARHYEIGRFAKDIATEEIQALPEFFSHCYTQHVLRYLLAARHSLNWKNDNTDCTLMSIILIYLHGSRDKSLSNQMRQGKSMAQEYSIRWWREHESTPPDVDPVSFIEQRILWRYKKGLPRITDGSRVVLGNSVMILDQIQSSLKIGEVPQFDLLFTSPPYYNITSYHYDQWLRLWLLGDNPIPKKAGGEWQDGFWSQTGYESLLRQVFQKSALVLSDNATIFVRTDARSFTKEITIKILKDTFPNKKLAIEPAPLQRASQTALFGDKSSKPGEIDLVLK